MTLKTTAALDALPVTQRLILELLAAQLRLGEPSWTFPAAARQPLRALCDAGLVWWHEAPASLSGTVAAGFTPDGRDQLLSAGYTAPVTVTTEWGIRVAGEKQVRRCVSREVARLNARAPHYAGRGRVVRSKVTREAWTDDEEG